MSIAIDLFNILKLIPEIGGRVYPSVLPQPPIYPSIIYQRISSIDTGTIEGTESLDMGRFQIKVFAKTYKAAVENAELVKTAMSRNGNKIGHMDDYENETQLHVQILDYIL